MIITVNLQIPVRLICVQCEQEISSPIGSSIAQCPKCGVKIRVEAAGPMGLGQNMPSYVKQNPNLPRRMPPLRIRNVG
jgi:DNA-directed RNA polymerase subunit RPC12/RpoP